MTERVSAEDTRTKIEPGISNSDHYINEELADALKAGDVYCEHCAWNFHGIIYWDAILEKFCEEVWVHGSRASWAVAPTLPELVALVNGEFGND